MDYEKREQAWIKKHRLKIGDKVKVVGSVRGNTDGWDNGWNSQMTNEIGKELKILDFSFNNSGISLGIYRYPYFVLQPVKKSILTKISKKDLDHQLI